MRSAVHEHGNAVVWEVAPPARPSRLAGVTMAGFRDRGMAPAGHRLIPPPAVTLVLDFGDGPLLVDDVTGQQYRGSVVAGLGLGGAVWVRGENMACVQVRMSPVIAGAVLGARPADLDGTMVVLDDLWGRDAARIREQLRGVVSWDDRFALTDALLVRRRAARSPVDPEVTWAWDRIVASRGLARVDQLAAELGWSRKRLWARFLSHIGMAPKRAAKLVRFDHAVHRLVAGQHPACVAADGGYSDQSHLHRDVTEFTGVTPAAVAREPFLAVDDIAWPATEHSLDAASVRR